MDIFLRREINSGDGAGSVQAAGFSSGKRLFSGIWQVQGMAQPVFIITIREVEAAVGATALGTEYLL